MVVNDRPLKKPKRNRVTANLSDFFSFPSPPAPPKPFRQNIKDFLSSHARVTFPPPLFPSLLTWQIVYRLGCPGGDDLVQDHDDLSPVVLLLDIVEEDVTRSCRSVYCNHCRVVGWSDHPVCTKRYHFMIRSKLSYNEDENQKLCTKCSNVLDLSSSRCKWCDSVITFDDVEDWIYSQFENNSHILHGVVHSNGFGHLLRVNGREGGSGNITGSQVMDFWDRICSSLSVREVSVMDVSRKYGIDYRLLHAITKGHSWYGDWGYKFARGSYGISSDSYTKAVETLSNLQLTPLLFHRRRPRSRLQAVISFYQSLSDSELVTLKDLCCFLLRLIQESNGSLVLKSKPKNFGSISNVLCAWTRHDVEYVQQAMIKVLETVPEKNNWVSRHALKGVLHKRGSPELLDYCLKYLGGKVAVNSTVIQVRCNPNSNDAEFRLAPLSTAQFGDVLNTVHPSKEDVKRDLKFVFDSLLDPIASFSFGPEVSGEDVVDAVTKLLDCKQFVKDYTPDKLILNNLSYIYALCHLEISDQPRDDPPIPPELIIVPSNATIADLKNEATKVFQEVYAMCKRFEAEELLEYGILDDSITLRLLLGTGGPVKIRGTCPSKHSLTQFRMERGTERWTVDCTCGAKDDDGEQMLACDNCGVWQHTRCAGLGNSDSIPSVFVCSSCAKSYTKKCKRNPNFKEVPFVSRTSSTCRGDAMKNEGVHVTFSVP
ncbi:PHD finger protein At1g33420 [Euphorbia peplus]|nr:PHD finger protein At1g33420 [Euphorbia peplus]